MVLLPESVKVEVLTGGPGSGKSTINEYLRENSREGGRFHRRLIFGSEMATMLLQAGHPPPGEIPDPAILRSFQHAIFWGSLSLETMLTEMAAERAREIGGNVVIVLDRGCLDGVAYMGGDFARFARELHIPHDRATLLARYHRVVHLQTHAVIPGSWSRSEGNEHRMENDPEIVIGLCNGVYAAYEGHPNLERIQASAEGMEGKVTRVVQIIEEMLR